MRLLLNILILITVLFAYQKGWSQEENGKLQIKVTASKDADQAIPMGSYPVLSSNGSFVGYEKWNKKDGKRYLVFNDNREIEIAPLSNVRASDDQKHVLKYGYDVVKNHRPGPESSMIWYSSDGHVINTNHTHTSGSKIAFSSKGNAAVFGFIENRGQSALVVPVQWPIPAGYRLSLKVTC